MASKSWIRRLIVYSAMITILLLVMSTPKSAERSQHNEPQREKVIMANGVVAAAAMSFLMHAANLPPMLGYILGGVAVGPIGFDRTDMRQELKELSEVGMVLLLFTIGLELDIYELTKLGRFVFSTGLLQSPVCACLHGVVLLALATVGIKFGSGEYTVLYVSCCCALSSTMIVMKELTNKGSTTSPAGRITVGVLICQDMWAVVMLVIQPNISSPSVAAIGWSFAMMGMLVGVSMGCSIYVLPMVLGRVSSTAEVLLVMSLAWCFFVCCFAMMPFVNLSSDLAALAAGASIASFPNVAQFVCKIAYIKDFFVALYFVSLGMRIPMPKLDILMKAVILCVTVAVVRFMVVFTTLRSLRASSSISILASINLVSISEFALILGIIGKHKHHIDEDTVTIMLWAFIFSAIFSCVFIQNSKMLVQVIQPVVVCVAQDIESDSEAADEDVNDEILILGLGKLCNPFLSRLKELRPEMLGKIHVIGPKADVERFESHGVHYRFDDLADTKSLEGVSRSIGIVLSLVPDLSLKGRSSMKLLEHCREAWPRALYVCIAERSQQALNLHEAGVDVVLVGDELCACKLVEFVVRRNR